MSTENFKISVRGLRNLFLEDFVEIKPITVLVGKNSSGKSSFARILPLLRQSQEARTKGPILWYGNYVDFGSFSEAVNKELDVKEIIFDINTTLSQKITYRLSYSRIASARRYSFGEPFLLDDVDINLRLVLRESSDGGTYISRIHINLCNKDGIIEADENGLVSKIIVGNFTYEPSSSEKIILFQQMNFIPELRFIRKHKFRKDRDDKAIPLTLETSPLNKHLENMVFNFVHNNTRKNTIRQIIGLLPITKKENFLETIKNIPAAPPSWRHTLNKLSNNNNRIDRLHDILIAHDLSGILSYVSEKFASQINKVKYIKPLRATAQRYYRQQDLAIQEIDSAGENLPMYLNSLSQKKRRHFEHWLDSFFGIQVTPKKVSGHITINVKTSGENYYTNIADMGFGISQILPVLAQLWSSYDNQPTTSHRKRIIPSDLIVIEQPELHLHPSHQVKISEILGEITKSDLDTTPNFLIETHSEHIVYKLGELIANGKIDKNNVEILVFNEVTPTYSQVSKATFDNEGVLANWPIGFFDAE
jgi:predicted ATPase